MLQKRHKLKIIDYIPFICLLFCFLSACFPMLGLYIPTVILIPGSIGVWFLYVTVFENARFGSYKLKIVYPVLFVIYTILIPYIFNRVVIAHRYMNLAIVPIAPIIYNYYKKNGKMYILSKIIKIVIPFLLFTTIKTIQALIKNPSASRALKYTESSKIALRNGVGGYSIIYFVVVVSIILAYIIVKDERPKVKLVCIGFELFAILLIFLSNYLTALVCLVVCVILTFTLSLTIGNRKRLFASVMVIVFAVIFLQFGTTLINKLIQLILQIAPKGRVADLLSGMDDSATNIIGAEMERDRLPTILQSIKVMLKHPILGLVVADAGELFSFGQHSHIMDTFALYGIPIGIVNILVLTEPFKTDGRFVKKGLSLSIPIALSMLMLWCANNAIPSMAIAYGFLYPMARDYYD